MHELSIAHGIFEIVAEHAPPPRASAVRDVRVRVGSEAGVLADSLEFCFEAIVAGTPWAAARLAVLPTDGRDLQVVDIEIDDHEVEAGES